MMMVRNDEREEESERMKRNRSKHSLKCQSIIFRFSLLLPTLTTFRSSFLSLIFVDPYINI